MKIKLENTKKESGQFTVYNKLSITYDSNNYNATTISITYLQIRYAFIFITISLACWVFCFVLYFLLLKLNTYLVLIFKGKKMA